MNVAIGTTGRLKVAPTPFSVVWISANGFGPPWLDRDGDGFRELPDGRPLTIHMGSATTEVDRQYDELWQRNMKAIGIRIEFVKQKWPELVKMARLGQLQTWRLGFIKFTPEAFEFYGLLYSKNIPFANAARFNLAEYDRLYEQARALPDSSERTKILRRMSEIVSAYAPWIFLSNRIENVVVQPWVVGYKYNPTYQFPFPYLDVTGQSQAVAVK